MTALIWVQSHWELVAGIVYCALNIANALFKGPQAQSTIHKLIDALSVLTRAEADGTLKLPLKASGKADAEPVLPNGVH